VWAVIREWRGGEGLSARDLGLGLSLGLGFVLKFGV
jgi:hypothetical protein